MGMYVSLCDERLKQLYQEEREKFGESSNSDTDFLALEKHLEKMGSGKEKEGTVQ